MSDSILPSIFQRLQTDIAGRLEGSAAFRYVPVTVIDALDAASAVQIQTKIDQQLAGMITKDGKAGLACLVLMPEMDTRNPDMPGPQLVADCIVRVIENPLINRGGGGVRMVPEELALTVMGLLHHWQPWPASCFYAAGKGALQQVEIKGKLAWDVRVTLPIGVDGFASLPMPVISVDETHQMTITGSGAQYLTYTLDGSLPNASNGTLWVAPILLPPGVYVIRAVARADFKADSGVRELAVDIDGSNQPDPEPEPE